MPRLVRKKPLMERVKALLNPMDFLLWLSEEIETRDWNSNVVGTQMGVAMNFVFLLARANSGGQGAADDVFGDGGGTGWVAFLAGTFVWCLTAFSILNSFYTINRTRKYRLFEADVEKPFSTPSAKRVRVQSSPASSSPLRVLTDIMSSESAESRAHPDPTRDVWEISVWDPLPISLRIFSLFSPGHILVYMLFLPLAPLEARPSVTVFNCLVLQVILSAQVIFLCSRFTQQNKDTAIIQKEVMNEYDTKFVHPHLYPTVRNAATQFSRDDFGNDYESVEVGTPSTILRRGFKTNPNPNYAKHVDPEGNTPLRTNTSSGINLGFSTPPVARHSDAFTSNTRSSAMRRGTPGHHTPMNPSALSTVSTANKPVQSATQTQTKGDGGYMGIYTHPKSPLKKAPSLGELQFRSPRNNSEMAHLEQFQAYKQREYRDRSVSPAKSSRKPTGTAPPQPSNPWARNRDSYERYPTMWGRQ